jgi:hypothetical protein
MCAADGTNAIVNCTLTKQHACELPQRLVIMDSKTIICQWCVLCAGAPGAAGFHLVHQEQEEGAVKLHSHPSTLECV